MSILKAKFNNVFQEGLGCYTKVKATLKLKSDSKPIFRPKRPVPYAALKIDLVSYPARAEGLVNSTIRSFSNSGK